MGPIASQRLSLSPRGFCLILRTISDRIPVAAAATEGAEETAVDEGAEPPGNTSAVVEGAEEEVGRAMAATVVGVWPKWPSSRLMAARFLEAASIVASIDESSIAASSNEPRREALALSFSCVTFASWRRILCAVALRALS